MKEHGSACQSITEHTKAYQRMIKHVRAYQTIARHCCINDTRYKGDELDM